jgi:diacylglycerol kinase family enzyme
LRWGRYERADRVRHRRCREVEIRTDRSIPINTDGEVTARTPARIVVVESAVAVFVPQTFWDSRKEDHVAE